MHASHVLAIAGLLAAPVTAFWRLPCVAPLVQERADPIVSPGQVASHLHTIMGGNGFDFTMTDSSTSASTCSSCTVQGDNSNYWVPVLFFKHKDGTFEKVNQIGGATVYYLQRNAQGETIKAFPKGFRMLAGDPFKRSGGSDAASQAISYNCLDYNGPAKPETGAFPTGNCPNGVRSQVFFPSCWDGKNLDSADHKSHVSYPDGAYNAGTCPSTHPVRLMALFYEIIWDTNVFANQWSGGSQPFVWSMGDPTGYGFHGDFINGWDVDLLQKAADTCTNLSGRVEDCPAFKLTPDNIASGCKVPSKVKDTITGLLQTLPGCNPIQPGPARANVASNCAGGSVASNPSTNVSSGSAPPSLSSSAPASSAIAQSGGIQSISPSYYYTDLTSKGWAYVGCAVDNYYSRSMSAASTTGNTMTNEACASFCQSKGYTYAGTEYSRECYCGNSFPSNRLPTPGVVGNCNMACSGNSTQWCGGAGLMGLYKKCASPGAGCTNAVIGIGASQNNPSGGSGTSTTQAASKPTTTVAYVTTKRSKTRSSTQHHSKTKHGGLQSRATDAALIDVDEVFQDVKRSDWSRHVASHLKRENQRRRGSRP